MMDITGIGMGLMMTGVAVAVSGLMLEAALMIMCRSLRIPVTASKEPAVIRLSQVERSRLETGNRPVSSLQITEGYCRERE